MSQLFRKKSLKELMDDHTGVSGEHTLKRTLTAANLVFLGIGAIIGAGLFVRTAAAAANNAGPSVTLGFIVAGIGCALAGLCYAEFASMIPIAGSAYTYSYATLGELVAWIIGWDLVLEYALGAATVSIAWSEYLNKLCKTFFHFEIPYQWYHSPFEHINTVVGDAIAKMPAELIVHAKNGVLMLTDKELSSLPANLISLVNVSHGIINIPALFILVVLSLLLIKGTSESAFVNGAIVITKVTIVVLFIGLGWSFIVPANHTPFIPEATTYFDSQNVPHHFGGIMGILGAAGVVFFAFIGFDAVSTAAQEAKNPKKDMPTGILGSLVICTVLYILFAYVLTGIGTTEDFRHAGKEASVAFVIETYMHNYQWLAKLVTVAILAGFSSVILVMLLGQSRVFYSMSKDGLLPSVFSELHPSFRTPYKSNMILFLFVGLFAAFVPEDIVGDMTSIGTLFAFILVCAGVIIMRKTDPDAPRSFKTPLVPVVPILGILVCGAMIFGLGLPNWLRLIAWLLIGFVIYFGYSIKHSKLNKNG
jgi:APA family basic amino acid/polyamine antiporter